METILYAFTFLLAGLVIRLVFTREQLVIGDGVLIRRNLLSIPRLYTPDTIGGMARGDVTYLVGPPSHYVIVYDKENRCLFKMNRVLWDPSDVRRLHARVGGRWPDAAGHDV